MAAGFWTKRGRGKRRSGPQGWGGWRIKWRALSSKQQNVESSFLARSAFAESGLVREVCDMSWLMGEPNNVILFSGISTIVTMLEGIVFLL